MLSFAGPMRGRPPTLGSGRDCEPAAPAVHPGIDPERLAVRPLREPDGGGGALDLHYLLARLAAAAAVGRGGCRARQARIAIIRTVPSVGGVYRRRRRHLARTLEPGGPGRAVEHRLAVLVAERAGRRCCAAHLASLRAPSLRHGVGAIGRLDPSPALPLAGHPARSTVIQVSTRCTPAYTGARDMT